MHHLHWLPVSVSPDRAQWHSYLRHFPNALRHPCFCYDPSLRLNEPFSMPFLSASLATCACLLCLRHVEHSLERSICEDVHLRLCWPAQSGKLGVIAPRRVFPPSCIDINRRWLRMAQSILHLASSLVGLFRSSALNLVPCLVMRPSLPDPRPSLMR